MNHNYLGYHDLLLDGRDYDSCRQWVESFFQRNELVRYDHIDIDREMSLMAKERDFWPRVEEGLRKNRKEIRKLAELLVEEGFGDFKTWETMPQGYLSKSVHTLAHLVDGFIGIDSAFYNCIEDSHSLSQGLRQRIELDPASYWLIRVDCFAEPDQADQLPFLRKQF